MTVSGLGSARSARSTPPPPIRAVRPVKTPPGRNDFDHLTAADRELIFQATGQRLDTGFDPEEESAPAFAVVLAAARATGQLAPGQEATSVFLKDLDQRYARAGGTNPVAGHLDQALAYLSRSGGRRIDVTA
jgi:hypothetical protein